MLRLTDERSNLRFSRDLQLLRYDPWAGMADKIARLTQVSPHLAGFWSGVFLLLHPFLKATFENAPLPPHFESRYLTILDHPVQSSFGNFEYACGFCES